MSTRCSGDDTDEAEKIRVLVKETFEMATKVAFGDVFGWPLERLAFWMFGKHAKDVTMRYDEILEKILKQHEERAKKEGLDREDRDLMDILLKVYQDHNAEFKITRTNIKAFLLVSLLNYTFTLFIIFFFYSMTLKITERSSLGKDHKILSKEYNLENKN